MQKINKKKVLIFAAIIGVLIGAVVFIVCNNKSGKYDYYYTFEYDDNLITQSVKVYDNNNKIQTNYYIFYKDDIVTLTQGDKAVLTISTLDLKDKPELVLVFENSSKKYSLGAKE